MTHYRNLAESDLGARRRREKALLSVDSAVSSRYLREE